MVHVVAHIVRRARRFTSVLQYASHGNSPEKSVKLIGCGQWLQGHWEQKHDYTLTSSVEVTRRLWHDSNPHVLVEFRKSGCRLRQHRGVLGQCRPSTNFLTLTPVLTDQLRCLSYTETQQVQYPRYLSRVRYGCPTGSAGHRRVQRQPPLSWREPLCLWRLRHDVLLLWGRLRDFPEGYKCQFTDEERWLWSTTVVGAARWFSRTQSLCPSSLLR